MNLKHNEIVSKFNEVVGLINVYNKDLYLMEDYIKLLNDKKSILLKDISNLENKLSLLRDEKNKINVEFKIRSEEVDKQKNIYNNKLSIIDKKNKEVDVLKEELINQTNKYSKIINSELENITDGKTVKTFKKK